MPKSSDGNLSSPTASSSRPHLSSFASHARSHVDGEGIELSPVKSVVIDTNKLKEEQAMAKWRVRS